MIASEAAYAAITKNDFSQSENTEKVLSSKAIELVDYEANMKSSWVWQELNQVRNVRPSFHSPLGLYGGVLYSGIDTLLLKGRTPWTFKHGDPDYKMLKPAKESQPIEYPKADGIISFDLLENVSRTGTFHEEDQPIHLKLQRGPNEQLEHNLKVFGGPEQKFCPGKQHFLSPSFLFVNDGDLLHLLSYKRYLNSQIHLI